MKDVKTGQSSHASHGDLIYGDALGSIVFMERVRAEDLSAARKAIARAKTWGKFKALVSKGIAEEIVALLDGEEPADGDPLDIPGYEDGDWPFPHQEQLVNLPKDVIQLGEVRETTLNGPRLDFSEKNMTEIIRRLQSHGFKVVKDDKLVKAACGC